jgi:hypothetical protein
VAEIAAIERHTKRHGRIVGRNMSIGAHNRRLSVKRILGLDFEIV